MKFKNKKRSFIATIILLIVILPMGILGLVLKLQNKQFDTDDKVPKNISQNFYHEGRLYFYTDANELIGTYTCTNDENSCKYVNNTIDDENYSLRYHKDNKNEIEMINNRYAFIIDGVESEVLLYDIVQKEILDDYEAVKNYGIGIENDRFIVKQDGKWGIISLEENNLSVILEPKFDYLGLLDKKTDEGTLHTDSFAALLNNVWAVLNENGIEISMNIYQEIVDFNGTYIITENKSLKYLYNYDAISFLSFDGYKDLSFTGKYINVFDSENDFFVYDIEDSKEITPRIKLKDDDVYSTKINNGQIEVTINGNTEKYQL